MSKISDSGIDDQQRASETSEVTITLHLPEELAGELQNAEAAEPEYIERVVQYALTRRAIYRGVRGRTAEHAREHGLRVDGFELDSEEAARRRAGR